MSEPVDDTNLSYRTIQHGLTYKHEIRHKRRHSTSPKRTTNTVPAPKRRPLTCVKEPLDNYKKLDIVGAKHDLSMLLETADTPDKENPAENAQEDVDLDDDTGKVFQLALETPQEDDEPQSSPVHSHQVRTQELAGIAVKKGVVAALAETSFETPVQSEEKSNQNPNRHRHQRVIENTEVLDPEQSPLADVSKGSIVVEDIEGETEVINELGEAKGIKELNEQPQVISSDYEDEDDAKMSPVRLSRKVLSPLSRFDLRAKQITKEEVDDEISERAAIFTATQLQHIKHLLQKSIDDLNQKVKQKEDAIDEKTREIDETNAKIGDLESQVESLSTEKSQLTNRVSALEVEAQSASEFATEADKKSNASGLKLRLAESKLDQYKKLYSDLMKAAKETESEASKQSVELAELHKHVSELQDEVSLKKSEVESLLEERSDWKAQLESAKATSTQSSKQLSAKQAEISELKQQISKLESERKLSSAQSAKQADLQEQLDSAQKKIAENDKETERQLEKLAQDLYLQYSAKHEQKVATLRKGYEMKWMGKVKRFTSDNEELKREIATLQKKLQVETNEKKRLVQLWDEYVSLEKSK